MDMNRFCSLSDIWVHPGYWGTVGFPGILRMIIGNFSDKKEWCFYLSSIITG